MRYLSVCSGIEAATVAWHPLGWEAAAFSEIEAFPRAVLAHHYPDTPLHGDFTTIGADEYGPVDLLVGGTPCQSFSVAGLRGGLADERGNLSLEFLKLAGRARPRWVVWENVPGVFSSLSHDAPPDPGPPQIDLDSGDGPQDGEEVVVEDSYDADESHAFACFLAGLSELGYGVAYRVLDAQFAGVPQRRRRVFVVGHLGDWRRAAAVLFERHSLSGHPAPRREAGQNAAARTARSVAIRGRDGTPQAELGDEVANAILTPNGGRAGVGVGAILEAYGGGNTSKALDVAACLVAKGHKCDFEVETFIAHSLRAEGFDASEDGTGRGTPLVPVCVHSDALNRSGEAATPSPDAQGRVRLRDAGMGVLDDGTSYNLTTGQPHAVAFTASEQANSYAWERDVYPTLNAQIPNDTSNIQQGIRQGSAVRRLTPRECERLQGFADDYTAVPYRGKPAADGPRYNALGNSMAVPVMRWIGERIQLVENLSNGD